MKAKNVLQATRIILARHAGEVPRERAPALEALPGVRPDERRHEHGVRRAHHRRGHAYLPCREPHGLAPGGTCARSRIASSSSCRRNSAPTRTTGCCCTDATSARRGGPCARSARYGTSAFIATKPNRDRRLFLRDEEVRQRAFEALRRCESDGSESVGCGWIVRPMSAASRPVRWRARSPAIRSPLRADDSAADRRGAVAASNEELGASLVTIQRERAAAREPGEGGLARAFRPAVSPRPSVTPTQATSGSVRTTAGMARLSKAAGFAGNDLGRDFRLAGGLVGQHRLPTTSPMAKMCGTVVRSCPSTGM